MMRASQETGIRSTSPRTFCFFSSSPRLLTKVLMSSSPSVSRWKFFSRMSSDSCSMHSRGCQQGPKASGCLPATRTSSWGLRQKCRASLSCGWLLWPPLQRVGSLICRGPRRRDGTILLELSLPLSLHAQGPRLQLRLPTTTMLGPLAEAGVFTRTAEPDIFQSKKHMSLREYTSLALTLKPKPTPTAHSPTGHGPRATGPLATPGPRIRVSLRWYATSDREMAELFERQGPDSSTV